MDINKYQPKMCCINKKTFLVHWINYHVLIDHLPFNCSLNSKKLSKSYLKVFLKFILSGVTYFYEIIFIFFDVYLFTEFGSIFFNYSR